MNEDKHVPGPWKVEVASDEDSDNYVYTVKEARDGDILGICDLNRYNKSHETLVATAELIASAPQLREQNQVLREALIIIQKSVNTRDEYASWLLGITEAALTATSQEGG